MLARHSEREWLSILYIRKVKSNSEHLDPLTPLVIFSRVFHSPRNHGEVMDTITRVPAQSWKDSDQKIRKVVRTSSSTDQGSQISSSWKCSLTLSNPLSITDITRATFNKAEQKQTSLVSVLEFQFGFTRLGSPLWEWELMEAKPSEGWRKALWTLWTERRDTDSPARACCEVLVTFLFFSGPQLSHLENGIR